MTRLNARLLRKMGDAYWELGRRDEGLASILAARKTFSALLDSDPRNTQPRYDLVVVDYDLGESNSIVGRWAVAYDALKRSVDNLKILIATDPSNRWWKSRLATALYYEGAAALQSGHREEGRTEIRAGLDGLIAASRGADASAENLFNAATALLGDATPIEWHDARLALEFAQRAVTKAHGEDPNELLILARAQQAVGETAGARRSIAATLALLPAPSLGQPPSSLRADAEKVASQLQAPQRR